jgi:hypothetical protein
MSCEVIVKHEDDLDSDEPRPSSGRCAENSKTPEVNGIESFDSAAVMHQLKSLEAKLMSEMQRMQVNLTAQIRGRAIDLDHLGFPLSKTYHIQTMADFLRDDEKYRETFVSAGFWSEFCDDILIDINQIFILFYFNLNYFLINLFFF